MDEETIAKFNVLKGKLAQLVDSLTTFLDIPPTATWTEILSQFNSLITKYDTLVGELQASYLKQLVAYPSSISARDPEYIPRLLLRTKLIPQIEDLEKSLGVQKADTLGNPTSGRIDENAVRAALRKIEIQIDLHEEMIKHAEETFDNFSDYNFKIRLDGDERGSVDEGGKKPQVLENATLKYETEMLPECHWDRKARFDRRFKL
ncbi:hypothetical protein HDU67_003784 [Dinochytrium kinnereticum]|nr:hypothetical protein HDU67_003784 [Dinochytrium kinnereticum]